MIFHLEIVSLDGIRGAIILNSRLHCEFSFPLQEEWLVQAIYSACRTQGIELSSILSHQNIIPSVIPFLLRKKKDQTFEKVTLEDLLS